MDLLHKTQTQIFYGALKALEASYRLDFPPQQQGQNYLLACWHEFLVPVAITQKFRCLHTMVSASPSGRTLGYSLKKLGFEPYYGSPCRRGTDKGGLKAQGGLLAALRAGHSVVLTVDGSLGPRRQVKSGIIELARRSACPIIPYCAHASSYWQFNTWDLFKLPKPFSSIRAAYGAPISIPAKLNKESLYKYLAEVGGAIDAVTDEVSAKLNKKDKAMRQ